jgi:DNA-binding CsgD family transcriptional regulator
LVSMGLANGAIDRRLGISQQRVFQLVRGTPHY